MMKTILTIAIVLAARDAVAERVRHVPPAEAQAGAQVELIADAPAATPTLIAHVRTSGQAQFTPIELVRRDDARWVAIVPATTVSAPGLDYYLDAGGQPVFASAEWPHTMPVYVAPDTERRSRDMVRSRGRRSRVHAMGEWVDYGTRISGTTRLVDRYYRIDGDFSYKLWAYPLEELRVGATRLLGDTVAPDFTKCPNGIGPCTAQAGLIAGWFELGLAAAEGVRLDARGIMMATTTGFEVGGRLEARLGVVEGSHVAVGVEHLADVGTSGFFRLGWGTVPMLPMSATVEVTNLPQIDRSTGVRLFYDVSRDIGNGLRLGIRVGYAARNQSVAGITGGAGASVEF
jgi:hypothetical protein